MNCFLAELILLNLPLLMTRVYIGLIYGDSVSVFLVKNILGIAFGIVEIYDCCYDYHKATLEKTHSSQPPSEPDSFKKIPEDNGNCNSKPTGVDITGYEDNGDLNTKSAGVDNSGCDNALNSNEVELQKSSD